MASAASAAEKAAFQAFLRGTSHLIVLMEADGTVRWVSPSVRTVLGYEPEEFCAHHPLELIHPDDARFVGELLALASTTELDGRLEDDDSRLAVDVRLRHRNGRWVTMEVLGNNLLATPGVRGRLIIARDISPRRALDDALTALADALGYEEAVRQVVHFLDVTVSGSAAAFWWPGHEPPWTTLQVPEVLLADKGPWCSLPADGSPLIVEDLKQALADGGMEPGLARRAIDSGFSACWCIPVPRPERSDSWGRRRAGSGWVGATGAFVFWSRSEGHPLVGHRVGIDRAAALAVFAMARHQFDEERAAQLERRRRQNEQLAEINALRTDLMLTMSHDLRTPLTSICGAAEMLAEGDPQTTAEERASYLEIIGHNTSRLLHMVDDLLMLAQLDTGALEPNHRPLDLITVATSAVDDVRPAARAKGVGLELSATPGRPLLGDPDQLRHLVDNLVSNAVKYTPAGGRICVEVGPTGAGWHLTVSDDGIGIPADELDQVFGRFARGSNAREAQIAGSGLGLVIARAVAAGHGGDITVESTEGRGSRFCVTLPCPAEP